jgi:Resolvase, N terminal domain
MEPGKPVSLRRCAIYTRKSSEEGLEQGFNSLHAQREACESFIKSQTGEGWRLIKTAYDDGGLSGGNMERPALKHLLADIGSGLSASNKVMRPTWSYCIRANQMPSASIDRTSSYYWLLAIQNSVSLHTHLSARTLVLETDSNPYPRGSHANSREESLARGRCPCTIR